MYGELRSSFLDAQLKGDRRTALDVVIKHGVKRGLAVSELLTGVIQDAQYEIGRMWESGGITIAQEHAATAISQMVVSHLYSFAEFAPSNRQKVLVACAQGERHDLGARIVSDFLEYAGFSVHFLGADVPVDALGDAVRSQRPALVVLSSASENRFDALREGIDIARNAGGDALPVFVGGYAFRDEAARRQFGDAAPAAADVHELVAIAKQVCGVRARASRPGPRPS